MDYLLPADLISILRGPVWIGLNDRIREARFRWSDDSELNATKYSNWAFHEGNESPRFHHQEDCVGMDPSNNGRWHDYRCDVIKVLKEPWDQVSFICEYHIIKTYMPTTKIKPLVNLITTSSTVVSFRKTTQSKSTRKSTSNISDPHKQTTRSRTTSTHQTTSTVNTSRSTKPNRSTTSVTKLTELIKSTLTEMPNAPTKVTITSTTGTTTPPPTICPVFNCNLDCGLDGYRINENGCFLCTCDDK